ncbi:MAG TPA: hypothetical protein VGE72_23990 [Azospirillum sp.]
MQPIPQIFTIDTAQTKDGRSYAATSVEIEFGSVARSVSVFKPSAWGMADVLGWMVGGVILAVLGVYGFVVIRRMWNGDIDLRYLISEPDGKASISRFQFLVFTFVVAGSLLAVTLTRGAFPTAMPQEVLWLLGISTLGYIGGKAVQTFGNAPADGASAPAGGGMLAFVQGNPAGGTPVLPPHAAVDAASTTPRPFRMTSGTKDWSHWLELTGFAGQVSFTLSVPQVRSGELDGEVRYTDQNGPATIDLATTRTFTTNNLIGTVEIRFRSHATAVEVNGTITP